MSDLANLINQLKILLGASAKFYPKKAKLDDYYEAYLWAETVRIARTKGWNVNFVNAGPAHDEFVFRMGPGLLTSKTNYTYAELSDGGSRAGELHIGIRVRGNSGVLHEFDVVALNGPEVRSARAAGLEPTHNATRLHIEAKFHDTDLTLGVGRGIVGLTLDCPQIHGFLVSRKRGSPNLRQLIKHYGATYVHSAFPGDTGVPYLHTCLTAAISSWSP